MSRDEHQFEPFPKIGRLSRDCVITEKIDGTNAQILVTEDGRILCGSRKRWITPDDDNFGFAKWCADNHDSLLGLGPGRHFGEWWGGGIQRGYGLSEKRFSLFNTSRWTADNVPACVSVVPVICQGLFSTDLVESAIEALRRSGSFASPGYMKPEGIVVFHKPTGYLFKKTIEKDDAGKEFNA